MNPLDSTRETKKYLKKLLNLIENEATFIFIKTRLVDKKRIDDIICCVEASFPEEYKNYLKRTGSRKLKSNYLWLQALDAIKNKTFWSSSLYSVYKNQAISSLANMSACLENDFNYVFNEASNMF